MQARATIALLAFALAGCVSAPPSGSLRASSIVIDHMVIPAADEAGVEVAAYAGFDNRGDDDRLLGIECECAQSVELHRVIRDEKGGRMEADFPLALPGGVRTEVRPPGIPLHFMLIKTKRPFVVGERVPMRLRFERNGTVEAVFAVAATSKEG